MKNKIKKRLRNTKWCVRLYKRVILIKYRMILKKLKETYRKKRYLICLVPTHGNLGDQAIAISEEKFFNDYFPNDYIIELPDELLRFGMEEVLKWINKDDVIVIHGGGFLGTLWFEMEELLRKIIKLCTENRIIILPQTVYYENTEIGRKELEISKKYYNLHQELKICLRDENSYDFVLNEGIIKKTENCFLLPDMVTYIKHCKGKTKRENILLCFRTDKEKSISDNEWAEFEDVLLKFENQIHETDTVVGRKVYSENRVQEVEEKLNFFMQHKIVVTDRLHGMLFAAITGTPCVAFDNISHKVSGVYEWIKYLEYIHVVSDVKEAKDIVNKYMSTEKYYEYQNDSLKIYFDTLRDLIVGE